MKAWPLREHLDQTDRRLVKLLSQDAQPGINKLAETMAISVPTVRSRLRNLLDRNLLKIVGLLNLTERPELISAIVGINAGAGLLAQLTGAVALKIFIAGFIACTIPPFIVWAIGFHVFKINPAVLMGGVAGARSHSGPCREAAVEIQSSVPWIGFPVGYAVSGILLTVFGYFAMILAQ